MRLSPAPAHRPTSGIRGSGSVRGVTRIEAVVGRVSSNIDWAQIKQGERDRKELERRAAERKQSDRR